jgi:hypothetical protein
MLVVNRANTGLCSTLTWKPSDVNPLGSKLCVVEFHSGRLRAYKLERENEERETELVTDELNHLSWARTSSCQDYWI